MVAEGVKQSGGGISGASAMVFRQNRVSLRARPVFLLREVVGLDRDRFFPASSAQTPTLLN